MSHTIEMICSAEYIHGRVQKTQVLAEDDGSLFHVLTTFQAFMRAMGFSNETIERHVKAEASTIPPLKAGDQVAYHDGNGWKYETIAHGDIAGAEINNKETLQGNDLSVQVEDDLQIGISETEDKIQYQWRRALDDEWKDYISADAPLYVDEFYIRVKPPVKQWGGESMEKLDGRHEPEYQPKFGPTNDGWITWNGGMRPVPGNCIVSVKWSDGTKNNSCHADTWRWSWDDGVVNMIAYKIEDQFSAERGDDAEAQV